ncbi:phenylalanine--tRNA ligase subunit beta [Calditrichota bacterium]
MRVSYNWLKDYVDFDLTAIELAEKLTMSGFEVEEIIPTLQKFNNIIVGQVLSCKKHPDADKLSICEVKIPGDTLNVICGAPNVAEKQKIAFAQIGVTLPAGIKIKKAKIRGVESFGMICSEEELGLAESSDGIWVLPEDWEIGSDVYSQIKNEEDFILDISITPNRPDAMSMIGIAREVAAIIGSNLRLPAFELKETSEKAGDYAQVEIQNPEGCPRYAAKIIKDVKIESSPKWMANRLIAAGIRPINIIVDITNYVLMEVGQPLHAFDFTNIAGDKIVVRDSKSGEKFTTLDEKEHQLPENTVLICDNEKPVAIGGVMGGLNSEVSESTSTIILESAYFNPIRIGRTSKKMGLSTEASQRFERGIDPNGVLFAANRAAYLMSEIAGGKILSNSIDNYPEQIKPKRFKVRIERINKVLGTNLEEKRINEILSSLEIDFKSGAVIIPTFRPDLEREIDIVEEIARMITFDEIPVEEKCDINYESKENEKDVFLTYLKRQLIELGLSEVITNSMMSMENMVDENWEKYTIPLLNPISDDMNIMRPSLLPGLLKVVTYNINRNQPDIRIFELGRIFHKQNNDLDSYQPYFIAGVINGSRYRKGWEGEPIDVDFYDIKGIIESLLAKIFLDNVDLFIYDSHIFFDEKHTIVLKYNDDIIGFLGKFKADVLKKFEIESEVFGFELNVDYILSIHNKNRQYKPFSKYPYIEKDLAFVFNDGVLSKDIMHTIANAGGNLVNFIDVFDLYKGKNIGEGNKSMAFRIRFQSFEKTLQDKEIDNLIKKIIQKVESIFKAKLRD